MTELEVLNLAKQKACAAAMAVWVRDEKQDRGTCGGAIMYLDSRTKLAKAAMANGFAQECCGDVSVKRDWSNEIRSQNMDVCEDYMLAFKKTLEENGFGKAIKKYWSYVD